ncbi:protein phosphatase Slingshot isoform X2 [Pectinophora gossypiella]|uniref:protein phosphatase Slingshot isoform X2 n=1 Tax=Pectinophora gossypiella TaxID=13191 RepID=UPI00214EBF3C|nr:protein phosphatase Slingshot isoform X2 [Pectinophora gossypiella]
MRQKNQATSLKMMLKTASAGGSLNECYFANKGAALVLGGGCSEQRRSPARAHPQPDIQHHLQSMFYLLRPEETLKMAVKLESAHAGRTRYLVVVCRGDEAALLGIDCNQHTTVGLVLRVLADTAIKLDGDGGFSVCVCNQQHIFKPVSVQAMWSALQTLHRASGRARELNHFAGGPSHAWCAFYESHVDSDRSCLNEWHAMDCIESRRPPSPDSLRVKPRERDETERVIRCKLKEVMMSVDLDEVTSKAIRGRLEEDLDMDLAEYKSFIDLEMLTILGQMDAPTEIFDHVYLGSEWNASNLEELQRNGVRHILNVTREIDNFFPGMFDYLNIRVYDDDKTDLLKHWDNTFKYINKARNEGSKVLVHCKMGISRSASVVIAYAMKAFNWNFEKALKHVKMKRNCIKPNTNFISQLETYQGILDAMKNKEKLQRSKSETNLKSPKTVSKAESKVMEPTPLVLALTGSYCGRPRSWSPDTKLASELLPPTSVSLENLASETRHMLMPCANGSYSVSPNQIIRLKEEGAPSVKHIVNEIENAASNDRRDFSRRYQKLNFGTQSDTHSNRSSETPTGSQPDTTGRPPQASPSKNLSHKCPHSNIEADKIHTWDPGETRWSRSEEIRNLSDSDNIVKSDSGIIDVKTKPSDALSSSVDRIADSDERRTVDDDPPPPPSRQSSWSSFDSAVVPDLSRHSSWGSYDTRVSRTQPVFRDDSIKRTKERPEDRPPRKDDEKSDPAATPQRPASDLSIISEHTEPAGRRRATNRPPVDISDNERKFNETCAILKELATAAARMERTRDRGASTWSGRLAASAPADTWLRAGPRAAPRRRRRAAASHGDLPRAAPPPPEGLVSNLKKEFEARSEADAPQRSKSRSRGPPSEGRDRPSSSPPAAEDLSVKVLVDRYDQPGRARCESSCEPRVKAPHESMSKKCKLTSEGEACAAGSEGAAGAGPAAGLARAEPRAGAALRNSFCGALRGERPPVAPTVVSIAPLDYPNMVVSTVMSKAQNKKQLQHGKTHPLTRLNLNRSNNRCSNPVYNTM